MKSKFIVRGKMNNDGSITTTEIKDNRTGEVMPKNWRCLGKFTNIFDLKESCNWNLNGRASAYKYRINEKNQTVTAYIYD